MCFYRHDGNYVEPPRRQGAKKFVTIVSNVRAGRISVGLVQSMRLSRRLNDTSMNSSWRLGALAVEKSFPLYLGGSETHV